MKELHLFIPEKIYVHGGTFYVPNNSWFNEMAKHFSITIYTHIVDLKEFDEKSKTPLDSSIICHHFFETTSTFDFLKNWAAYRHKLMQLPKDDHFMVFYPFKEISIFLAWLLRKHKLTVWVRSDTNEVMLSKHMMFSDGILKGVYRLLINPLKSFIYTIVTKYLLKKTLVFYTGNTLFNKSNHRDQHEIISCPILNKDKKIIKNNLNYSIAFVGNEHPRKGLSILLRALHNTKTKETITLNIIGCDELKNRSNKKLAAGIQIKYHGPIYERTNFYSLLAQNDILVMPSFAEKQGKVQLEAMSTGVVPICSDSGGTYQTINNFYTGLLFKPGNSKGLAWHIDLLYSSPTLYQEILQNGLDYTNSLSLEKQIEKMTTIMNNHFTYTTKYEKTI